MMALSLLMESLNFAHLFPDTDTSNRDLSRQLKVVKFAPHSLCSPIDLSFLDFVDP
jgi:hypothetical protein